MKRTARSDAAAVITQTPATRDIRYLGRRGSTDECLFFIGIPARTPGAVYCGLLR
jgi:hypothetical protein